MDVLLCACGAAISLRARRCRRCTVRLAAARWRKTEKGKRYQKSEPRKAANARYRKSGKFRAVLARYWKTEKGRATKARQNKKHKAAQVRYQKSEKGRARAVRFRQSDKYKAAIARYWNSEKGRAKKTEVNARQIRLGGIYRGLAPTVEQAVVIRNHIKERKLEFIARQSSRAEAEGA